MKVQNSFNPAFKSKHLYTAKLKQNLPFLPVRIERDVFISELEPNDEQRMRELKDSWERTQYGTHIIETFLTYCFERFTRPKKNLEKFYTIEIPGFNSKGKVKGFAVAEQMDDFIYLSMLQSDNEKRKRTHIKGLGSCLLYAVSKLAEENNFNSVYILAVPEAVEFYKKAGTESIGPRGVDFVIRNHIKSIN